MALIEYIKQNKQEDNDWFKVESNKEGTKWWGKCWIIYEFVKYEFKLEFEVNRDRYCADSHGLSSHAYRDGAA
jgi:hypothetical protein